MKAVLAAGGTAGHINPAISIAQEILRREPDSEIRFIGRFDGMEARIVPQYGLEFVPMEFHGFMRSLKWEDIKFNLHTLKCVRVATRQTRKLLEEFKPDVVVGCGGYVSGPVVRAAIQKGVPAVIQEQNSFPGLATKLLARRADLIFVPNEDARERIGRPEKTVIAGNPVNAETGKYDRDRAREELGVGDRRCVLSFGGSLGARSINSVVLEMLGKAGETGEFFFVHATGSGREEMFSSGLAERGVDLDRVPCRITTYINDMPRCLAAADLVVCRAGATTVAELEAAGRASYLIPFPQATENHQYFNARTLADAGAALLEEEKDLEPGRTAERILETARDRERTEEMGRAARTLAKADTASVIYERIRELIG